MFGYGYRLFGSQISAVQNYTRNYIVAVSSVINRFTSQGSLVSGFCCGGKWFVSFMVCGWWGVSTGLVRGRLEFHGCWCHWVQTSDLGLYVCIIRYVGYALRGLLCLRFFLVLYYTTLHVLTVPPLLDVTVPRNIRINLRMDSTTY